MHWNANRIELILGLILALTGATGLFSAYRRSASGLEARARRLADLFTFVGVTIFGASISVQWSRPWLHIVVQLVALVCFATAMVVRRRAKRSSAT